jgi:prepilin-type N-terminal cleavage/methylation domain-containing protein
MINLKSQNNIETQAGFTLVEMLVSVALFSIVIVVTMGSILTIIDVNRKSQTMMVVMNDLNFSLESFTRTVKTGQFEYVNEARTELAVINQVGSEVVYKIENEAIHRRVDPDPLDGSTPEFIKLTSDQIVITEGVFKVFNDSDNEQPRVLVALEGSVSISPRITSSFKIQTTVSQRNLDDYNN